MDTHNDPLLSWQASARPNHERSGRWYVIAGVLAGSLIIYGILSGAWTMSIAVALAAGLYFLVRNDLHRVHVVKILPLGLEIDGKLEPWGRWKEFWILANHEMGELHVASKGFRADFVVLTADINLLQLRDTLSQFIPQNPQRREKILDAFTRYCKL